jgi:hypothetical protein
MSDAPHQLLITLVHGTWGRAFFWRRPLWFEDGSLFFSRLSKELHGIPHKITSFSWSGANSVFVRDKFAHVLAEQLATQHAENPQATQVVIAHSHGGNIALRALHRMQSDGPDAVNPLVVTLAAPFVEVHPADFGSRPFYIRFGLVSLVFLPLYSKVTDSLLGPYPFGTSPGSSARTLIVLLEMLFFIWFGWWWIWRRASARQKKVSALTNATRLGEIISGKRLLAIRVIDDEASLAMALGTIVNYITARSVVFLIVFFGWFITIVSWYSDVFDWSIGADTWFGRRWGAIEHPIAIALRYGFDLIIILFCILVVSRSVHGRELPISPMECQINTQSTPDGVGAKVVTLVSRTYAKSLRHGIYDHEDCAKTISDWVRSQLPSRL